MTGLTQVTFGDPYGAALTLVTFAVLALFVSASAALVYRWYFRTELPEGVAVLFGVAVVALYLNTTSLGEVVGSTESTLLTAESVFFNVVALGVAAAVSPAGRYAGDRLAVDVFALTGVREVDGQLSRMVRTVGRVTVVTLPPAAEIEDMETYEPVSDEKKAEMSEKSLLFPRRLTLEELRERLVQRVKTDYGVGYVDVDLAEDGTLDYFAVGSRATGLGPTLAPGTVAVAVAADPPNSATVGDMVQIWRTEPEPERVATGELRGIAGDVTTIALDGSDAEKLSVEGGYRLVTLPAEPQADREFASLLRNADETMSAITVSAGSPLVGTAVSDVAAVVAAVQPVDGNVQAIPQRGYTFAAGDTVYLVGRPDTIRRFEADATANAEATTENATESSDENAGMSDENATESSDENAGPSNENAGESSGENRTESSDENRTESSGENRTESSDESAEKRDTSQRS